MKFIDLTGQKFSKLTVIKLHDKINGLTRWECLCDCGNKSIVQSGALKGCFIKSCGCLNREEKIIDLINQRFGKLVVISREKTINHRVFWNCQCECGKLLKVAGNNLKSGGTSSCGCVGREKIINRNTTHNKSKTTEYKIWGFMKNRCLNKNDTHYLSYGGRGITICEEWINSFEAFLKDMGKRPSKEYSLDRIDNNLGYYKENCRWATIEQQANNKRTNRLIEYNGEIKTLMEWSNFLKIDYPNLQNRLKRNWSIEKAFSTPVKRKISKMYIDIN